MLKQITIKKNGWEIFRSMLWLILKVYGLFEYNKVSLLVCYFKGNGPGNERACFSMNCCLRFMCGHCHSQNIQCYFWGDNVSLPSPSENVPLAWRPRPLSAMASHTIYSLF